MQFQSIPLSPMVKKIIILNVGVWFFLQIVLEGLILPNDFITYYFSFTPQLTLEKFFVWQPLTYMFLHSMNVFHVMLNMISLWFFGSELEYRWGGRNFLRYYLICGIGAAIIYFIGVILVSLVKGTTPFVYNVPVLGASGAVFGVLLAYGILFGERIIYFFGVFPMKAKIFLLLIGGMEIFSLLSAGLGGTQVANLAHIGGLITGFLYLIVWTKWQRNHWKKAKSGKGRRNLRLVVNNPSDSKKSEGPKYWN